LEAVPAQRECPQPTAARLARNRLQFPPNFAYESRQRQEATRSGQRGFELPNGGNMLRSSRYFNEPDTRRANLYRTTQ